MVGNDTITVNDKNSAPFYFTSTNNMNEIKDHDQYQGEQDLVRNQNPNDSVLQSRSDQFIISQSSY